MTTEERCADAIAREARRTAAAGAVFAVLWVLGFGLADADVWVVGFPLWAITSTVGVMVVGALLAFYLARTAEDVPFESHGEGAQR